MPKFFNPLLPVLWVCGVDGGGANIVIIDLGKNFFLLPGFDLKFLDFLELLAFFGYKEMKDVPLKKKALIKDLTSWSTYVNHH